MMDTPKTLTRDPYDLDETERVAAEKESAEFAATIGPWRIPIEHGFRYGTYKEKRPGLGIVILGYDIDCSVEPHRWSICYDAHAWRSTY